MELPETGTENECRPRQHLLGALLEHMVKNENAIIIWHFAFLIKCPAQLVRLHKLPTWKGKMKIQMDKLQESILDKLNLTF